MDGGKIKYREAVFRKKPKLSELKFPLSKILPIKVPLGLDWFAFLKITYKKWKDPHEFRTADQKIVPFYLLRLQNLLRTNGNLTYTLGQHHP